MEFRAYNSHSAREADSPGIEAWDEVWLEEWKREQGNRMALDVEYLEREVKKEEDLYAKLRRQQKMVESVVLVGVVCIFLLLIFNVFWR